jgi:hypothetical protein
VVVVAIKLLSERDPAMRDQKLTLTEGSDSTRSRGAGSGAERGDAALQVGAEAYPVGAARWRLLDGSVGGHAATHAPVPVLVVR